MCGVSFLEKKREGIKLDGDAYSSENMFPSDADASCHKTSGRNKCGFMTV